MSIKVRGDYSVSISLKIRGDHSVGICIKVRDHSVSLHISTKKVNFCVYIVYH